MIELTKFNLLNCKHVYNKSWAQTPNFEFMY